jgi:2-keto-4-pentenoate hydratase/2-oxohepta-3-ene-1,7-dioic acid hydratase in catechol pathway
MGESSKNIYTGTVKLVTFEVATPVGPFERLGALADDQIIDLNFAQAALLKVSGRATPQKLADAVLPANMLDFLAAGDEALDAARHALQFAERSSVVGPRGEQIVYRENEARLLSPLPRPRALRDFFAFEEHAKQGAARRKEPLAAEWYDQPVYYKGNHREIYGPATTVPWPSYTRKLDFELEIGCVVGRQGRDLSPEDAKKHIAGYTILNDFSARDIQKSEMVCRMGPAKGKDFGTGLGPYLLTADELPSPDGLKMTVSVNGEVWSQGDSSGRYWGFPLMLSHVSQEETVYPGDLLGSGTYFRGCGLDMDRWIKPGDVLEMTVEKLGTLKHVVGKPREQTQLKYAKEEASRGAHR